jgi:hypothetical protein
VREAAFDEQGDHAFATIAARLGLESATDFHQPRGQQSICCGLDHLRRAGPRR